MKNETPKCRLFELRKMLELTQEQFANQLEISTNTVSNIENNRNPLSIDTAYKIAMKYNVSLDWLYLLNDDKSTNILDSFSSFFNLGERTIVDEERIDPMEKTFLTMRLSSVVRDYLLEKNEIEKINKEKDLPEAAYKAWLESVKAKYLKKLEVNETGEMVEFVLIENDEDFSKHIAIVRIRMAYEN